jgi:hypothetical protein
LQVDPLGFASKWKPGGALVGNGSAVTGGMFASPSFRCETVTSPALSLSNLLIAAQFQCVKSFYSCRGVTSAIFVLTACPRNNRTIRLTGPRTIKYGTIARANATISSSAA